MIFWPNSVRFKIKKINQFHKYHSNHINNKEIAKLFKIALFKFKLYK